MMSSRYTSTTVLAVLCLSVVASATPSVHTRARQAITASHGSQGHKGDTSHTDWRLGRPSPNARMYVYRDSVQGTYHTRELASTSRLTDFASLSGPRGEPVLVTGDWKDTVNTTGWANFEVHGNPDNGTDTDMAYAAGYLEGSVSGVRMRQFYENTRTTLSKDVLDFIAQNNAWIDKQITDFPNDSFWHHVSLLRAQLKGLMDGYRSACAKFNGCDLDDFAFEYLNLGGDLSSIQAALAAKAGNPVDPVFSAEDGRCSALIALTPNAQELYSSHVTWTELVDMLRVYKFYDLPYTVRGNKGENVPGSRVQFPSYPGSLFSGDDWYVMQPSGLVTMETTFGNSNPDLWKYVTPQTVLEWMRNMVANRLANTGQDWAREFSLYNSGTYCNSWMILDYKKFLAGNPTLPPNTFWLLEQLPGNIESADMTSHLNEFGYWASYNIPYFPKMQQLSGFDKLIAKYGSFYNHTSAPRALMFDRAVPIKNLEEMKAVMRYNDFKNDPLARCNCTPPYTGENGISARSDLNDPNGQYPIPAFKIRPHGGIDCKMTSSELMKTFSSTALSGPTNTNLPTFEWATSYYKDLPHTGLPDKFDFPFVDMKWQE